MGANVASFMVNNTPGFVGVNGVTVLLELLVKVICSKKVRVLLTTG